jgi:uncharacterized membrane protein YqaE (UPF0057 family)
MSVLLVALLLLLLLLLLQVWSRLCVQHHPAGCVNRPAAPLVQVGGGEGRGRAAGSYKSSLLICLLCYLPALLFASYFHQHH